jgi:beta-N-acetylhexosaminidase
MGILALVAAGCSADTAFSPSKAGFVDEPAPTTTTEPPCEPASLMERAARTLIVGLPDVTSPDDPLVEEVLRVGVGGVLLTHANVQSAEQVRALVSAIEERSRHPIIISADEEPGRVRTFEALFGYEPSPRRQAAESTVEDVRLGALATAGRLRELGVELNMAPVADVYGGPAEGIIGDRAYSDDPAVVAEYVMAYSIGLAEGGVTPVVKHFPGHGRSAEDDHVGTPLVGTALADLQGHDLVPFARMVQSGAPVVMMGNVAYDALDGDLPASLSPNAYRLLRDLGFTGAAITDSLGMGAVNLRWNLGDAALMAIAAGADGLLATDGWASNWIADALRARVEEGILSEARLNEAATRMILLAGGDPHPVTCMRTTMPTWQVR